MHLVDISAWFPKMSTDPAELTEIVVEQAAELKTSISNYLSSLFAADEGTVHLSAQTLCFICIQFSIWFVKEYSDVLYCFIFPRWYSWH